LLIYIARIAKGNRLMTAISGGRATDQRVTCLRIFADAIGETHMEDVDII
jgi:hypothetical protein